MRYDDLLSRLAGVRTAPPATDCTRAHRAFCPVHQPSGPRPGRTPSLALAEKNDGSALVHCHAGCSVQEVMGAVGMDMVNLYPQRGGDERGNGGPAKWASAAALADAVVDAAALVVVGGIEQFEALDRAVAEFKTAARAALRADAKERRAAK